MRIGLYADRANLDWASLAPLWREADQLPAIESAWTFDHLHIYPVDFRPGARRPNADPPSRSTVDIVQAIRHRVSSLRTRGSTPELGPCLEGWTSLAALLSLTDRLRGGVLVTSMFLRHPAVLAKMVASVDVISQGRLELGLGAGWSTEESEAYGIDLGGWRERFDRFDEGVECVASLLSNDTTTFDGRYFKLRNALCEPKPVQRPRPPICIGGAGETRTVPAVARWAQTWQAGFDLDALPRKIDVLHVECDKIHRDPAEITIAMLVYWNGRSKAQLADHFGVLQAAGAHLALVSLPGNARRYLSPLVEAATA